MVKPPKPFSISKDSVKYCKTWKHCFQFYSKAVELDKKDLKIQTAIFMSVVGYDAIAIYSSFNPKTERKNYLKICVG